MDEPRDKRCRDILDTVVKYKAANDGNSPTLRQLGGWLGGLSTSIVSKHLNTWRTTGSYFSRKRARRGASG